MGPILSVVAAVAVVLGLVTLFKPIPRLKLTTRGRSLLLVALGLGVLLVAGKPPQSGPSGGPGGPGGMAGIGQQNGPGGPGGGPQGGPGGPGGPGGKRQKPGNQDVPMLPDTIPAKQLRFLALLDDARVAAETTPNPQATVAIQAQRRDSVCELMQDPAATNWVGRIKAMKADQQGRGMLAVEIGNKAVLTTAVNPRDADETETLVPRTSPLYQEISRFKSGDMVVLSGKFLGSADSCLRDIGTLADPVFLFTFSSVSRYRY